MELNYCTGASCGGGQTRFSILHNVPFMADLDNYSMMLLCLKFKVQHHVFEGDVGVDDDDDRFDDFDLTDLMDSSNVLVKEGNPCVSMHVIGGDVNETGCDCVSISKDGYELGQLQRGDFFGELAVLRHVTFTATKPRAHERCTPRPLPQTVESRGCIKPRPGDRAGQ